MQADSNSKDLLAACAYIVKEARRLCALPARPYMEFGVCRLLKYTEDAVAKVDLNIYEVVTSFIDGELYVNLANGWSPERETILAMLATLTAEELFEIVTSKIPTMTPPQAYKPAHGGYPQTRGCPYASLGAAKAQAQRDAEARRCALLALWDEPTFENTGMLATPDAQYRIVASADNAH